MSTKTKDYQTNITATIVTSAVVRSSDEPEKVQEYTATAFMKAMGAKGIGVTDIKVDVIELEEQIIMPPGVDQQNKP